MTDSQNDRVQSCEHAYDDVAGAMAVWAAVHPSEPGLGVAAAAYGTHLTGEIVCPREDLIDRWFGGVAAAITDIREKVVEEPTYGRPLSNSQEAPLWSPGSDTYKAMEQFYGVDRDRGIDR